MQSVLVCAYAALLLTKEVDGSVPHHVGDVFLVYWHGVTAFRVLYSVTLAFSDTRIMGGRGICNQIANSLFDLPLCVVMRQRKRWWCYWRRGIYFVLNNAALDVQLTVLCIGAKTQY